MPGLKRSFAGSRTQGNGPSFVPSSPVTPSNLFAISNREEQFGETPRFVVASASWEEWSSSCCRDVHPTGLLHSWNRSSAGSAGSEMVTASLLLLLLLPTEVAL